MKNVWGLRSFAFKRVQKGVKGIFRAPSLHYLFLLRAPPFTIFKDGIPSLYNFCLEPPFLVTLIFFQWPPPPPPKYHFKGKALSCNLYSGFTLLTSHHHWAWLRSIHYSLDQTILWITCTILLLFTTFLMLIFKEHSELKVVYIFLNRLALCMDIIIQNISHNIFHNQMKLAKLH